MWYKATISKININPRLTVFSLRFLLIQYPDWAFLCFFFFLKRERGKNSFISAQFEILMWRSPWPCKSSVWVILTVSVTSFQKPVPLPRRQVAVCFRVPWTQVSQMSAPEGDWLDWLNISHKDLSGWKSYRGEWSSESLTAGGRQTPLLILSS